MTRSRMWQRLLSLVAMVILLSAVAVLNLYRARVDPSAPAVSVVAVRPSVWRTVVRAQGVLELQDPEELFAMVGGRLAEVRVKVGDPVAKGDVLARFDEEELDQAVAEARRLHAEAVARLEALQRQQQVEASQARAELEQARLHREQVAKEVELELRPRRDLVESDAALRAAEARASQGLVSDGEIAAARIAAEAARTALAHAEADRTRRDVRAPRAGTVVGVKVKSGQQVQRGDPLFTLADLDHLVARVRVDELDIGRIRLAQAVIVRPLAEGLGEATGTVRSISPVARREGNAAYFEVEVAVQGASHLRPGLSVDADVVVAEEEGVIAIPPDSLTRWAGQEGVFVVGGERARFRPVETGREARDRLEVVKGLGPGDQVIAGPKQVLARLVDGARIRVAREEARGDG